MTSTHSQSNSKEFMEECSSKYFSDEEKASIAKFTAIKHYQKGDILIREGQVASTCYHVISGCLRQYKIVNGEERSIFFYTEDQSVLSLVQKNSIFIANYNIDCVEDTTVSLMTAEDESELYRLHPKLETLSRKSLEKMVKDFQNMFSDFLLSSPEERYLNLLENQPDLISRVPQYHLASYIGVKPESLSRIRNRLAKK